MKYLASINSNPRRKVAIIFQEGFTVRIERGSCFDFGEGTKIDPRATIVKIDKEIRVKMISHKRDRGG